jgi:hypothetical protein
MSVVCTLAKWYVKVHSAYETKKRKKKQTPAGPALHMRQYITYPSNGLKKKKESDKAAVLTSLQIMTKKRIK